MRTNTCTSLIGACISIMFTRACPSAPLHLLSTTKRASGIECVRIALGMRPRPIAQLAVEIAWVSVAEDLAEQLQAE